MTLLFLILVGRIYYVQVVQGAEWYELAKARWSANEVLPAKRGTIMDRNGNVLAMDTVAYNMAVNPKLIHEQDIASEVVDGLNEILGIPKETLREHVEAKKSDGNYLSQREVRDGGWQLDKTTADKINEFSRELSKEKKVADVGIYLFDQQKRYYPKKELASQVVGYLDKENQAMTGIEASFNEQLSGVDGYIKYEKDGKRVQLAEGEVDYEPEQNGQNVKLTIDSDIQQYAQDALKEIVKKYNPKSATAIAADPNTMEILAMANTPTYNGNEYWINNQGSYNHAVKSIYEPGSTFKIVTLAAAVEEGLFDPDEKYKSGEIYFPKVAKPIRDIKRGGWGTISFLEGLKYSSNVAFVKLGYEKLGEEKFKDYINKFGFGQKTGIQLGGELSGRVQLTYPIEVANATFGQGVSVTPIQQVAAVAAVANGGKLMQPQIVKEIIDPTTKTTTKVEPKLIRQVISADTSKLVGEYLEQVVSDKLIGTGKDAYIEGYRVAGKTGTAQKTNISGKGYAADKFVVSFIGYAPVENPKIVVYIIVDEPNDPGVGGGKVAGPAFKEIVQKSLRKMGVAPSYDMDEDSGKTEVSVTVPKVVDLSVAQAKAEVKVKGMDFEQVGNGTKVLQQIPPAGSVVHPTQRVYLITEPPEKLAIPDLTGVSLRDALEFTTLIGVRLIPEGQGYVVSQQQETLNNVKVLRVKLAPQEEGTVIDPSTGGSDTGEATNPDGEQQTGQDGAGSAGQTEQTGETEQTNESNSDSSAANGQDAEAPPDSSTSE
jgi:penicillin-binding protein 2B